MKNTIKILSLITFMVISSVSFAAEETTKKVSAELDVKIAALDKMSLAVVFDKYEGETVKIKIYNKEGSLVYSEKESRGTRYGKKFNLSSLDSKKYTCEVSNELYSVSKVIELK